MHPPDSVMFAGTLIPLLAVLLGGLLLHIPVAGLTVRYALHPALQTLTRVQELRGRSEEGRRIERRVELLEQQIQTLALVRILEGGEIPRQPGGPTRGSLPDDGRAVPKLDPARSPEVAMGWIGGGWRI